MPFPLLLDQPGDMTMTLKDSQSSFVRSKSAVRMIGLLLSLWWCFWKPSAAFSSTVSVTLLLRWQRWAGLSMMKGVQKGWFQPQQGGESVWCVVITAAGFLVDMVRSFGSQSLSSRQGWVASLQLAQMACHSQQTNVESTSCSNVRWP